MTTDLGRAILRQVSELFSPLTSLADPDGLADLLSEAGWDALALGVTDPAAFVSAVAALEDAVSAVEQLRDQDSVEVADVAGALEALGVAVAGALVALRSIQPSAGAPPDALLTLGEDLLALLFSKFLAGCYPRLALAARLAGVMKRTEIAAVTSADGHILRSPSVQYVIDPAAVVKALENPLGYARTAFLLDPAGARRLADEIADFIGPDLAEALLWIPVGAGYGTIPAVLAGSLTPAEQAAAKHLLLAVVPLPVMSAGVAAQLMVSLGLTDNTQAGEGLGLLAAVSGDLSLSLPTGSGTLTADIAGAQQPLLITGRGVRLTSGSNEPALTVKVTYSTDPGGGTPAVRLGSAGTRLQVDRLTVALSVTSDGGTVDLAGTVDLTGVLLALQRADGDGFLSSVLPADPIEAHADLGLDASLQKGLRIRGGAGLEAVLPLQAGIGPLSIDSLFLALKTAASAVTAELSVSASLTLGPFEAAIDRIGARASLQSSTGGGSLGPVQLDVAFKPPTGVGLAINMPAVTGGGFLLFDPDAGQYAGVFELTIIKTVSVKAIAIITTKMPDGSAGFALLILITADGFTPIQLGLGFSITGMGGLLAINHTVDADAVRGGLRSGVLDSILFVKDPVKNASRVLASLNQVFPPAADRLLIGPLAEISWGTPPLVKIRLALLLEVPQPIRVVLLAALSMTFPTPDNAVVEIHIDAIGVLDFGKRELALDASLHDSRILRFALTGDMALRLSFADVPVFLFSAGGFHPKYLPPKGLRPLNRLALTLSDSNNPRIRFEAYLALTSNTIQMGARVDVHAEEGGFGLDGGGSFDSLIQWSPFSLDVAFAAWVKITSGGSTLAAMSVALEVTGPQPWHVTGQASVQVLVFTASVGVDITIGLPPAVAEAIEAIDVAAEIWAQLSDPAQWVATLAATTAPGVTLAGVPVASATAPLVAHPLATVSVRQHIAPLDTPIERVGGRLPVGGTRSYSASVTTPAGVAGGTITDMFAPGQYANLPDDARLAGPSFAALNAGLSLTPQSAASAGPGLSWDMAVQTLDVSALDVPATPGAWVAVAAGTARGPVPAPAAPIGQVTT